MRCFALRVLFHRASSYRARPWTAKLPSSSFARRALRVRAPLAALNLRGCTVGIGGASPIFRFQAAALNFTSLHAAFAAMPYCAADKYSQNGSLATLWRRQRGVAGDLTSLFIISAWFLAVDPRRALQAD